MAPRVVVAIDDAGIAEVRLNRPEKRNALDPTMFEQLIAAGEGLMSAPIRAVVLTGAGEAFCAGIDLASLAAGPVPDLTTRTHGNANLWQQAALIWRQLPVPVIAAIHGACLGGGLQIVAGADIRIAAPDARLGILEARHGIIPDMGGFALWRGLVREDVLREATYTARIFTGEEAVALGFATILDADPLARAHALARTIATQNLAGIRAAKAIFGIARDAGMDAILHAESKAQQGLIGRMGKQG